MTSSISSLSLILVVLGGPIDKLLYRTKKGSTEMFAGARRAWNEANKYSTINGPFDVLALAYIPSFPFTYGNLL